MTLPSDSAPELPSGATRAWLGASGLAALAALGFWTWRHASLVLENPAPLETTCAAWLADPPPERWVRLTHCTVETRNARFERRFGAYRAAWVPVRADGDLSDTPARLALLTTDPAYLGIAGDDRTTPDGTLWRLSFDMPPLHGMRVEGVLDWEVRPAGELVERGVFAADVRWIRHDARPSPALAVALAVALLGGGGAWLRAVVRRPGV